jgi:hypothetical protein
MLAKEYCRSKSSSEAMIFDLFNFLIFMWIFVPVVWKILKLVNERSVVKPRRYHDEDPPLN